ncbi:uncharacterized protein LOC132747495 [Ruditapes philippinarum]|uniref:uncharacterized protein LOC132747495 n=1 Tax=Ruditapes philippinarum TaxID=129788 RepID=UPI00295B9124|nr:uncharacterized protein LOC132747495 [Ruditapes philippinarum]
MSKVHHYHISMSAFPSYKYVCGRVSQLHKRYEDLLGEIGVNGTIEHPKFDTCGVDVFLIDSPNDSVTLQINDFISNRSFIQHVKGLSFKDGMPALTTHQGGTYSGMIAPILIPEALEDSVELQGLKNVKTKLFVIRDNKLNDKLKTYSDGRIYTTKEQVVDDVSDELEKEILKSIKLEYEHVKILLDKRKSFDKGNNCQNHRGRVDDIHKRERNDKCVNIEVKSRAKYVDENVSEENISKQTFEKFETTKTRQVIMLEDKIYDTDKFSKDVLKKLRYVEMDKIVSLYAEMTALFRTSCLSTEEQPISCCTENIQVDKQIETGTPPNSIFGTLGCFASMHKRNNHHVYALTAKHILSQGDFFSCPEHGYNKPIGQVVPKTVPPAGLDIAALKLNEEIRFCTKFRTELDCEDTNLLPCKLYDYVEDDESGILCCGQLVYIWGAASKPGKGVITVPKYLTNDMEEGLIVIEDRYSCQGDIPERFCKPGDSGAIVCVEDRRGKCVHVLAMVMGILNENAVQSNPASRAKYVTVPLSIGLQELTNRTGFSFQLSGCIHACK